MDSNSSSTSEKKLISSNDPVMQITLDVLLQELIGLDEDNTENITDEFLERLTTKKTAENIDQLEQNIVEDDSSKSSCADNPPEDQQNIHENDSGSDFQYLYKFETSMKVEDFVKDNKSDEEKADVSNRNSKAR